MMEVCLPGTGGMVPRHERYLSCCYVFYNGNAMLIDCGEGTQIALSKAGCRISRLKVILITHYHADHVAGLPGLLLSIGNTGKRTPLTIAGPAGLIEVVSALRVIAPALPYPLNLVVLGQPTATLCMDDVHVDALSLDHGIPCMGYRISVMRKPVFNPDKARNLSVPKRLYHTLHAGHSVVLENGKTVTTDMVTDGPRPPLRVCYVTDTRFFAGLVPWAEHADLLIAEGMYGDEAMRQKAHDRGHMLFSDSAGIAKAAHVKRLWLTHYSPAVDDPAVHLPLARRIFLHTDAGYDGIRMDV